MPEGDTLWRAAAELQRRIAGRRIIDARPAALARLGGRTVERVEARGKHLYMHVSGGLVLHTHMRMTGAWHLYAPTDRWRRPPHRTTAVLDLGDLRAVLFDAPVCELVAPSRVGDGLGPDILGEGSQLDEIVARARRSGHRTTGELLLDQAVCAGIGNIYRCEALWHERVDPMAPPETLTDEALAALFARARDLLRRGAVADRFRARRAVHGRAGRPCPACGELVQVAPLGRPSRVVFWCPRCQPGPAGRAAPVAQAAGSTQ